MNKNILTHATVQAERFIPVSKFAILEHFKKLGEVNNDEKNYYPDFFQYLIACRHQKYRKKLNELKKCYLPFSPDRDTLRILEYSDSGLKTLQQTVINEISSMMVQANYKQITIDSLNDIFSVHSPYQLELKVDLSEFEELLLFSRGSRTETYQHRRISTFFLTKSTYKVPIFQRLFLLLKLKPRHLRLQEIMNERSVNREKAEKLLKKYRSVLPESTNDNHIYLKLFKDIPQADLKMLFPNTQVKLKLFDKIKLGFTAGGGSVGGIFATFTKMAAATNPVTAAGALLGLIGVIFRQIKNFFNQHTKYMMTLAQKLYFHNLANNRGVLTLLMDRAEEEEIKEAVILYAFLSRNKINRKQLPQLKRHIEVYFDKRFSAKIHFYIEEPLASLKQDELLKEDKNGNLTVLDVKTACKHLEQKWHNYLVYNDLVYNDESSDQNNDSEL